MNPNNKCHCGSGKKFKKCCQYGEKLDNGIEVSDEEFYTGITRFVAMQQEPEFKERYKDWNVALTDQGLELYPKFKRPIFPETFRHSNNKT